jgi:hypothetical protein
LRRNTAIFCIICSVAVPLYLTFIIIPFHSGPCWFRWCANDWNDPLLDRLAVFQWLLPLITWLALVLLGRRYARDDLIYSLTIWFSLVIFLLAGCTGFFFFWRYTGQGLPVSNGGTIIEGTISYANNVVDNSVKAVMSGLLLGLFISIAAPSIAQFYMRPFLFVENNILRRSPPTTTIFSTYPVVEDAYRKRLSRLVLRSLLITITLAVAYSKLFPVIFPAQSSAGLTVIMPAFIALLGFYSTIVPATVQFLESNSYVVRRYGEQDKPFSEVVMRWVAIGVSLSAIITVLGGVSGVVPFVMDPISILYAFLNFMQAPLAILGSCISIGAFLGAMSRSSFIRKWGWLAMIFVVIYRTDLFDFLFLREPISQVVNLAGVFSDFINGSSAPFGIYWYPLAVAATIVILVMIKQNLSPQAFLSISLFAALGIVFAFVQPFTPFSSNQGGWALWVPTVEVLDLSVLGYVLWSTYASFSARRNAIVSDE